MVERLKLVESLCRASQGQLLAWHEEYNTLTHFCQVCVNEDWLKYMRFTLEIKKPPQYLAHSCYVNSYS